MAPSFGWVTALRRAFARNRKLHNNSGAESRFHGTRTCAVSKRPGGRHQRRRLGDPLQRLPNRSHNRSTKATSPQPRRGLQAEDAPGRRREDPGRGTGGHQRRSSHPSGRRNHHIWQLDAEFLHPHARCQLAGRNATHKPRLPHSHVYPALEHVALKDVTKFQVQMLLNRLAAEEYSYTVVYHVRDRSPRMTHWYLPKTTLS